MKSRPRPEKMVKASIDVWLADDMLFNNPPGMNIKKYKRFTKAVKIPYKREHIFWLDRMELAIESRMHKEDIRAVAILLDGKVRYVWRDDVLNKEEYTNERAKTKKRSLEKIANATRNVVES